MSLEIVKFIPSDIRLQMTQDFIQEKGIRPLAREIDVNPKSVYKYKEGSSCPGDEVMGKILALIKKEDPDLFEKNIDRLRDGFSSAVDSAVEAEPVLTEGKQEEELVDLEETEEEPEIEDKTEPAAESGVGSESSDEEKSVEGICDRIDVTSPFKRSKVRKILEALAEVSEPDMDDLVEQTSLSEDAIENYLEMLESDEFVKQDDSGSYRLLIRIGDV